MPHSTFTCTEDGSTVSVLYLKPSTYIQFLLANEPWLLLGGYRPGEKARELLKCFWDAYRTEHPTHKVYDMARRGEVDLQFTIPLVVHGDGGRTQKKAPMEILSIQPFVGLDTEGEDLWCHCQTPAKYSGKRNLDAMSLRTNGRNHSYLTHFLVFALATKRYPSNPGLLQALIAEVMDDLGEACKNGFMVGTQKWHVAVLGMKGDMEWHAKIGLLERSYQNVGTANFKMCCHLCEAGSFNYPFEHYSVPASWVSTMYRSVPWRQQRLPFTAVPYEDWNSGKASSWFKGDPFHIFRLGICRNFLASAVIMLCLEGLFDGPGDGTAIQDRLDRAWGCFSLWSQTFNYTLSGVRSFSRQKLHFGTMSSFPFIGCKGSDSVILLRWLRFQAGLLLGQHPTVSCLKHIIKACDNGLAFQGYHRHGIFLRPSCRDRLSKACKGFLKSYAFLAEIALNNQQTLFAQIPKAHALCHVFVNLELSRLRSDCLALNPGCWDCSMSEDFVGRVSRQSRRVSSRELSATTMRMYLIKTRFLIQRYKKEHHPRR